MEALIVGLQLLLTLGVMIVTGVSGASAMDVGFWIGPLAATGGAVALLLPDRMAAVASTLWAVLAAVAVVGPWGLAIGTAGKGLIVAVTALFLAWLIAVPHARQGGLDTTLGRGQWFNLSLLVLVLLTALMVVVEGSVVMGALISVLTVLPASLVLAEFFGRPLRANRVNAATIGLLAMQGIAAAIYGGLPVAWLIALAGALMIAKAWTIRRLQHRRGTTLRRLPAFGAIAALLGGCGVLRPYTRIERPEHHGSIRLTLSDSARLMLRGDGGPWSIRVRIHAVSDPGSAPGSGPQEGNDHTQSVDGQGAADVHLTGIRLGWKDLVVHLLGAAGEIRAEGTVRHLVRPGAQTLAEPLVLTIRPAEEQRVDLPVALFVRIVTQDSPSVTTWLDVRPLIDASCVAGCHVTAAGRPAAGGLDLSDFPFKSDKPDTSQDSIVKDSLDAVRDLQDLYRMPKPPAPRLTAAEIALLESWRDGGLIKYPAADSASALAARIRVAWTMRGGSGTGSVELTRGADPEQPFAGSCPQVVAGARYDFHLTVLAEDGSAVLEESLENQLVDATFRLERILTLDASTSPPVVTVPVVIRGP